MKLCCLLALVASVAGAAPESIILHSRHIPAEHLQLNDFARAARTETHTTCLDPDKIGRLVDWGVDTIELRLVWWALEKTPGVFDWSRFDRDLGRVEAAGMKGGLMFWFFFPPAWYREMTPWHCTRHDADANFFSPWDPKALEVADRLYAAVAARYGRRIDFFYTMSASDYGESMAPIGVGHYKFSGKHTHAGLSWAGDRYARAAWARMSNRSVEAVLAGKTDRATELMYMDFFTGRVADYTAEVFALARRHFPWARFGHPIGGGEAVMGNDRALTIKRLCQVSTNLTVRWTSLGSERDFSRSNVFARRVSSACRFYGCPFGEEASHPMTLANTNLFNHAMYEIVANNARMVHHDYHPMQLCGDENVAKMRALRLSDPVCDVAILWPDIAEKLWAVAHEADPVLHQLPLWPHLYVNLVRRASVIRKSTDYEIVDTNMIRDGFLEKMGIRKVIALTPIPPETEAVLAPFRARGGLVTNGDEYPRFVDNPVYRTVHRDFVSTFNPRTGEITYE